MAEFIKLVADDYTTKNDFKWTIGETVSATGERGQGLCSSEYLHVYETEAMAALMAPNHGVDHYTRALVVEGESRGFDGTKHGLREAKVVREIPLPTLTTKQRVAITIIAASRVYLDAGWTAWASGWLNDTNRTSDEAAWAARAAAWAAAKAAAAWAAEAAARAAAEAAEAAAWAAAEAARAAAKAAAAWAADGGVDLPAICKLVLSTPESRWAELLG
jgi:hypothetical protein